ncbi:telomeric repeat binding factor a isoform X3 [Ctenopharyngodon idella]|uniref:telomeric repeat binding factor a isoform X3 n=1 Tax=Ctenopharyngodon idella TaxID=7959 RepID=UPI002231E1FB|nr:telomeric repeat binding factor a isoform X3 [Ctenopharyngodon idella]
MRAFTLNPARMNEDERIINRWYFDVCVFKALESFRNGDYTIFANIINVIESMVVLPMDGRGDTVLKLRVMQFLSRINNGDKLDLTFEEPKTPLESALGVLESLCRELDVPQQEQQRVRNAITEMLIIVCIKSGEFEKAEEILKRHFSAAADSSGKKKLLVNLIRRRRSSHSVLQLSSYSDFKQDMLEFIERLYCVPEPFLTQMLKRTGHLRAGAEPMTSSREGRRSTQKPRAAEDHGVSSTAAVRVQLSLQSLRQVYGELSRECGVSVPFSQLLEEVEMEAQQQSRESSGAELHLALSETPMEQLERAAEDEPPAADKRYAGMTISRLVMEDDSQLSEDDSQNDVTAAEEETQISGGPPDRPSPQRVIIGSDPESDDPEVQTVTRTPTDKQRENRVIIGSDPESDDPEVQTVRQTPTDKQRENRMIIRSDPESDDPEVQTVTRTSTEKQRENSESACVSKVHSAAQRSTHSSPPSVRGAHRSGGESSSTPARHLSITPSVRRSDKKKHSNRRMIVSSDEEAEDPPSDRRSARQELHDDSEPECVLEVCPAAQSSTPARRSRDAQSDHRSRVSSESESEVHSTRSQVRSSPADSRSSTGGKHSAKRARWRDASGTHEDWSDEESLFSTASGPSRKKRYARKLWTLQESDWLKEGVRRFGAGHWEQIRAAFPFKGRTACNLKDRWRTMVKLKMV